MNRRPAAFLFLSALLGAFFGCHAGAPSWYLWAALACALLALVPVVCLRVFLFLGWIFFLVGWAAAVERDHFLTTTQLVPSSDALYDGTILESAKKENGSELLLVEATAVNDRAKTIFNLRLRLEDTATTLPTSAGRAIRFKGRVTALEKPISPSFFDAARYGLAHTIHGKVTITDAKLLWIGDEIKSPYFALMRSKFRERLVSVLSPHEASILLALMIGDTSLFNPTQNETFESIGAQHLLAVSGLQVTLLAWLCFFLLGPAVCFLMPTSHFHYGRAFTALLALLVILWFVGLSGFSKSAIRAFLMTAFMFAPMLVARTIDPLDAFFASGIFVLLWAPTSVLDLGFLLSYSAVFGLIVAHARSKDWLVTLRARSRVLSYGASLSICSMAAFLATLPVIAVTFRSFAPMSIFANLFLVPFATFFQIPAIVLGMIGCLTDSPLLIEAAGFFGNLIEIFAEFLAEFFASSFHVPPLSNLALASLFIALNLLFFAGLKQSRMIAGCAIALLLWPTYEFFAQPDALLVTVIPVGQGDATLFSFANGTTMLIDAGGQTYGNFDPGERIVLPTLKRKGVNAIDILVISHPHPDHVQGAFALMDKLRIKEIWHSGFSPDHPLTKKLVAKAYEKHITVRVTNDLLGSHKIGQSEVQVLAPCSQEGYFPELSANDNSLVIKIVHGQNALLWPGDLEYFGEQLLLASGVNVSATVLKAPHHGSKTSSSDGFLSAVKPTHVIYSTGQNNRFHFPHDEVVARYRRFGAMDWNTATDGEITITVNLDKISIDGYQTLFKEKTRALPLIAKTIGQHHESTSHFDQQSLR